MVFIGVAGGRTTPSPQCSTAVLYYQYVVCVIMSINNKQSVILSDAATVQYFQVHLLQVGLGTAKQPSFQSARKSSARPNVIVTKISSSECNLRLANVEMLYMSLYGAGACTRVCG